MISELVRKIRARVRALFVLRVLAALSILCGTALAAFGFVYSVPAASGVCLAAVVLAVLAVVRFAAGLFSGSRGVPARIEEAVYGKRVLAVDSILEFAAAGAYPARTRSEELRLRSGGALSAFERGETSRFRSRAVIAAILIAAGAALAVWSLPAFAEKADGVRRFYRADPAGELPRYYIEGKPLTVDLSAVCASFDSLAVGVSNRIVEGGGGRFTIGAEFTTGKTLELKVYAAKFGLKRLAADAVLDGTTRLLPNKMTMTVVYPFGEDRYASLQDVEIWRGGRIVVEGGMTKTLTNVTVLPDGAAGSVNGNDFTAAFTPPASGDRKLVFASVDGDRFESPAFAVRMLDNAAPVIRLVYPNGTIVLSYYQWTIQSILESEDDQGVAAVYCRVVVTNRDPELDYRTVLDYRYPGGNEKYLRSQIKFDWQQLEILPNDAATVSFYCEDVFGKRSRTVSFVIVSPDLTEMDERREALVREANRSIGSATNSLGELRRQLSDRDYAGASGTASEAQSELSNLTGTLDSLRQDYAADAAQIDDVRRTMEKIREISDFISKNSDMLSNLSQSLRQNQPDTRRLDTQSMQMNRMLDELSALMNSLEYYKKVSDLLAQMDILQNAYEGLKSSTNASSFERRMQSYERELQNMLDTGGETTDPTVRQLQAEAGNLREGDAGSFTRSDELMSELSSQVNDAAGQAGQNRTREQIQKIGQAVEELFLEETVLQEAKAVDTGTFASPNVSNVTRVVELMNSVNLSFKEVNRRVEETIEGMVFEGDAKQELRGLLEKNRQSLDRALSALRDNNVRQFGSALGSVSGYTAAAAVYLMKVRQALDEMLAQQQSGGGAPQAQSVGMGDLMAMQSMMSRNLQQLMQQMQGQGAMSEEMRQMMQQMSQLQSEIQQNLRRLMQQSGGGLVEGGGDMNGMMNDIIKDLDSYNVTPDDVQASRDLEQRMLDSMRALQSRGISDERRAQTAGVYQAAPPAANSASEFRRTDLSSVRDPEISEYYRELIERYAQTRGNAGETQ